ncbi:hemerythrin domain-containing protein [Endothiovibrio diazotrophicus]
MKRDPDLTRISWDHHAALTVADRILNGLENGVDPAVIADYALHTWQNWLHGHNRMEEELLERRIAPTPLDPRMVRRLREEHEEMEQLAAKLWERSERLPVHLNNFAGTVRNHIRFEEQELLPALERTHPATPVEATPIDPDGLHEMLAMEWHPAFWD